MRWFAAMLLGSSLVAGGCSSPEPDLSKVLDVRERTGQDEEQEPSEFDFGAVVARDQTLRHEFQLSNREDRPLRIRVAKVNVPCCSGVGKLPEEVGPRGVATIPVFLKAGHIPERKRVTFEIATDAPSEPMRTLTLTAQFFPEWEVAEVDVPSETAAIGRASKRRLKVTYRRKGGEGRKPASDLSATPNLQVGPNAEEGEFEGSNGVIEATREFDVTLAGQPQPGPQLGSIAFRWPDGSTRTHEIRWEVKPSLKLSPAAFALPASDQPSSITVVIQSDGRPFRITGVTGPLLAEAPSLTVEAKLTQALSMKLDTARTAPDGKNEVRIVTDNPDQPTLSLSVLIIPGEKGLPR